MKKIYLAIIGLVVLSTSCEDELNQKPISSATTLTFYQTQNDFVQGINAVYAGLNAYPERILNLSETRSDNLYAVSDGGVRDWEGVNSFHSTLSTNPFVAEAWAANYNGIFKANNFLDQLSKNGAAIKEAGLQTRLEAEAKFLRAMFYFDLVRWFGKVPLVDKVVSQAEALEIPRSSVADVYKLIISDLQFAATNLPISYTATNVGRATNLAAKSTLALVYMTRSGANYGIEGPGIDSKEWNLALSLLNEVISSGKHSLLPSYPNVFSYTNENNAEVIFDIQFISGGLGLGTTHPVVLAPDTYFTSNGLPNQTLTIRPISENLLASYEKDDARKAFSILSGYKATNGIQETRSFYKKYIDLTKYGKSRTDWPINFIVMRYADVLLMKAECLLQTGGSVDEALALVNQIRKRAGLAALKSITIPELMEERRKEFAGEGLRWHDLVRSGLVEKVISAWIPAEDVLKQMKAFNKNYIIYPLPQSELDVKSGLYTQNPGY